MVGGLITEGVGMYTLKQAQRAIRTNWIASISTIATMTLSLMVLSGFSLLTLNLNSFLDSIRNELEISVFLDDSANPQQIKSVIEKWNEIDSINFISKDQGLLALEGNIPEARALADIIGNPLENRFDIRVLNPALTPEISRRLSQLSGVSHVSDGSRAAETYMAVSNSVRIIGLSLIIILLISSLFAIINSIRAAITARQSEIEVMRLVGATKDYIRGPYLLEGFLLGLFSGILTLALVAPSYFYVVANLSEKFPFFPFERDLSVLVRVAGLLFSLSLLVGLVGATFSVTQYLREKNE